MRMRKKVTIYPQSDGTNLTIEVEGVTKAEIIFFLETAKHAILSGAQPILKVDDRAQGDENTPWKAK